MPQSRNRKLNKAKKRPRVAPSGGAPAAAKSSDNFLKIGAVVVIVALAAGVVWFLISRNNPARGAVTTESGLKYVDMKVGDGPSPQPGKKISVHYTGTLENGQKFDSSRDKGVPFEFNIGRGEVIPGWDEGLMSMKVGGRRKLTIPPDLAYGSRARPGIPANSTLVFDVELLGIK